MARILGFLLFFSVSSWIAFAEVRDRDDGNATVACQYKGQVLRGLFGVIRSPGFIQRENYPPLSVCKWILVLPAEKFLKLKFLTFDLELSNDCTVDRLEIFSGKQNRLLRRDCGFQTPRDFVVSAAEEIQLQFYSDDIYSYGGFELEYSVLDKYAPCPEGSFRCRSGDCVTSVTTCNGEDECGDGTDEENCGSKLEIPKTCGATPIPPVLGNGDRIIGGTTAVPGSWPWQISIQRYRSFPSAHFCGGALVNNLWIVTAAHCVHGLPTKNLRIHLGKYDYFVKEQGELTRYPDKIFVHPTFNKGKMKDDIALIKMNAPVAYTNRIQPVCLPGPNDALQTGTMCHVTGWGRTYGTGDSNMLKQVATPVISLPNCRKYHPNLINDNNICAGFLGGRDAPCQGDSGGPFVCNANRTSWNLNGIVSWGPPVCAIPRQPSVYTNVSSYLTWINDKMSNE